MKRRIAVPLCLLALACDGAQVRPCGQIPGAGCPIGRGGTCEDVTCDALYDCVEGEWSLVAQCDNPVTASASTGAGAAGGQGGCAPAIIDHTTEVRGCTPDLQEPDCPAVAAETCPSPCLTGCVDFFLCEARGWELVAYCDRSGSIVVVQGTGQ